MATIKQIQLQDKPEINLIKVKIALKRSLLDYEETRRSYDETFDVYDYLSETLAQGFAEPTLRKWVNPHNTEFCDPEKLITICLLINDTRPIEILISYLKHRIK